MDEKQIQESIDRIRDKFINFLNSVNIEVDIPEILSQTGIQSLNLLEELIKVYFEITKLCKDSRDTLEHNISLFKIKKQAELMKDSKYKISEAELDKYANADIQIFQEKLLINELEAEQILVEEEIKNIREFINLLKKGVESKKELERDYKKIEM